MPVYVYRREDGSTFELEQRMAESALVLCPATGQAVARVLQPFAARYTGTGFYSTDHRKPGAEDQVQGDRGRRSSAAPDADRAHGPEGVRP